MTARASATDSGASAVESVRWYVILPSSNRLCRSFIVASGFKPRRTDAACWTVAVVNGAGALREASRRSQESTFHSCVLSWATVFSASAAWGWRWPSGCSFQVICLAVNGGERAGFSSRAERMK